MKGSSGDTRHISFSVPFERGDIPGLIRQYLKEDARGSVNDSHIQALVSSIKRQRCLTLDQLRTVARWKSPRSARLVDGNAEGYVRDDTGIALSTPVERLRIEVLTLLDGVSWPTASVILHWFHEEPYPILDRRALTSVGAGGHSYNFALWKQYTDFCRREAKAAGISMRDLDRALWQHDLNLNRRTRAVASG